MRVPYCWLLGVGLLAGVTIVGSGCARKEPAATTTGPAAGTTNLAPSAPGGAPPGEAEREERYREAIRAAAVNNPAVAALIPRRPTMGGSWRVGSKEDVHFLGNGEVALDYEDGHVAGRLVVKVKDPHDPKSWTVIRDEPK